MEVLINIIIVLVIISSLFKRMREIAKKGDDVRLPPARRPDWMPPTTENMDDQSELPDVSPSDWDEATEVPPTDAGTPSLEELFERMLQKPNPPEPARPDRMPLPETVSPGLRGPIAVPVRAVRPAAVTEYGRTGAETRHTATSGIHPTFSGPEVVLGMVMGEILGPPVALRE